QSARDIETQQRLLEEIKQSTLLVIAFNAFQKTIKNPALDPDICRAAKEAVIHANEMAKSLLYNDTYKYNVYFCDISKIRFFTESLNLATQMISAPEEEKYRKNLLIS